MFTRLHSQYTETYPCFSSYVYKISGVYNVYIVARKQRNLSRYRSLLFFVTRKIYKQTRIPYLFLNDL